MNEMPAKRPSIRQVQLERTRHAILEAAQQTFAECGYAEAGVRDIAARAGVNPALVGRYFGSKIELYEEALRASFDVTHFTGADRRNFGETIAAAFCQTPSEAAAAVPMLVFAAGDSLARKSALRILKESVIEPLERWFGEPEAKERAAQLLAVVTGFFTYRLMLPLETMEGEPTPAMRRWLVQTLQEIVDRDRDGSPSAA